TGGSEPADAGDAPIDSIPGFSLPEPPAAAPSPQAPPADAPSPEAAPADAPDDDFDETRMVVARAPQSGATLTWDDGTITHVAQAAVFGRNPSDKDAPGATTVSVRDTTRSLSKTHFAVYVESGSVWVVDASSTNGTEIHRVNGAVDNAPATQRVQLNDGDARSEERRVGKERGYRG